MQVRAGQLPARKAAVAGDRGGEQAEGAEHGRGQQGIVAKGIEVHVGKSGRSDQQRPHQQPHLSAVEQRRKVQQRHLLLPLLAPRHLLRPETIHALHPLLLHEELHTRKRIQGHHLQHQPASISRDAGPGFRLCLLPHLLRELRAGIRGVAGSQVDVREHRVLYTRSLCLWDDRRQCRRVQRRKVHHRPHLLRLLRTAIREHSERHNDRHLRLTQGPTIGDV